MILKFIFSIEKKLFTELVEEWIFLASLLMDKP